MPTLLLVDGHSQAYRAFFGVKTPLSTRNGEPTGAVYGFAGKLLSLLKKYDPEYMAVAFDLGDTWRHAEFADYKATRDSMPSEMRTQMTRIEQFLVALNVPIVTYPNYEADDVIGTLARAAAAQDVDVLILTGDRDMFQLVTDKVKILYTKGGPNPETVLYGPAELHDRYGLSPLQIIELKALTGDTSDNIPGVPGVGEKTAVKFLQDYGDVAGLYAHVDAVSGPKTRQNLIDAHDQVIRNRRLVTITTDLPLEFDPNRCRWRDYDYDAVYRLFNELEFRTLIRELPPPTGQPDAGAPAQSASESSGQMGLFAASEGAAQAVAPVSTGKYLAIQDDDALARLVAALQAAPVISFDVETTGIDAMQAELVGLGLAWAAGEAAYIPVAHKYGAQLPWPTVVDALQPIFSDPARQWLAHNGKYDLTVSRRYGLNIAGPIRDTMIMAWVLDSGSRELGLKAQAAALLDWRMTEITDLIGSGRKQITMAEVSIPPATDYCGADVDATIQIAAVLEPRLHEAGLWDLFAEVELPLLPVLTDMEMSGVLLDTSYLAIMSEKLTARLAELEQELYQLVGHSFNLRSTQQLSQVLFDEMQFPVRGLKRTASGHISTAVDTLEQLAAMEGLTEAQQAVLGIIMEQRQLEKLRGTYVDALPKLVNAHTGRLHTNFNQSGAVTGRVSSSNPNLQNIPIRTDLGREIRRAFIAPPGWALISADYSQVELRILSHIADEQALLDAFRADLDIHTATASRLFQVPLDQVSRSQRSLAKMINFATIYGVSEFGLSSRTEMNRGQAREFLDQYFVTYPRIRSYIAATLEKANRLGYVETLLGRKRFFPELANDRLPYNQRQAVERAAINAPIQGTAADIMKIAMIRLHGQLRDLRYRARMLLQVHDELVLEVPEDEVEVTAALVRDTMSSAYTLAVPLKVDVEAGPNWYDLEPV